MADAAIPRRGLGSLATPRVQATEWALANRETLVLAGIVLIAALLRFWDLGSRAIHHDESLHATYSWYLYEGRRYIHDPLMHGPFQFHAGALSFFLFGDSDYTARIPHALAGTILVAMPVLLRRQIGMKAVLIASTLIAFSPTLLYFSRFDREDALTIVWTFAIVICLWRYLDERKDVWLGGMAFSLALAFATKETTFISVTIILVFLDLMLAIDLGRKREGETIDSFSVLARTLVLVPVAGFVSVFWPLLGRKPFGRDEMPAPAVAFLVLATLSLPQFSAGIQVLPFVKNDGYFVASENSLRVTSVAVLLMASAYCGLLWKPKQWLTIALYFYVPFILLFTTFFTNTPAPWQDAFWQGQGGFFTGIWGSLDYWLDQHAVRRGEQPLYYYALVTPLYEFLPLVLALAGAWWMAFKGTALTRWLLFWLGGTFLGLTLAGEKMPWLEVHIALPLAIIAAISLARILDTLDFSGQWPKTLALAAASALATVLLVQLDSTVASYGGFLLLGAVLGLLAVTLPLEGTRALGRSALAVMLAVLLTLTIRSGLIASFEHGDVPVELLVYTQTSPDIPDLRDRIDAVAEQSGLGYNLPIIIDSTSGFTWPWAWYLRDYKAVGYIPAPTAGYQLPEGSVALIAAANSGGLDTTGYQEGELYVHRWWFAETYRDLTLGKALDILTTPSRLKSLGDFFLNRREMTVGSSEDAIAYFPDDLAVFDTKRPIVAAAEPTTQSDGRIVVGRAGSRPGEFQQPADLFVDGAGNVWVADSRNGRIQKFDAQGNLITTLGRFGSVNGQFNEPWSVAVDADGFVYVADTWNHRIQKYSPDLEFIQSWGGPALRPQPGPFDLFGPRDIAIAPDGSLWVTDTGNKRLLHYSADGDALGEFGTAGSAPGQFDEQVGIAIDSAGNLFVADTWNARIQKFSDGFGSRSAFSVPWASREVAHKPYLALLTDGRIVASDPGRGLLLLFDGSGRPLGQWRPAEGSMPIGVAATADGGFVFSDGRRAEIQIVPEPAIGSLFK